MPTLHGRTVPDRRLRRPSRLVRPDEQDRSKRLTAPHHYPGFQAPVEPTAQHAVASDPWVVLWEWATPALRRRLREHRIGWVAPLIDRLRRGRQGLARLGPQPNPPFISRTPRGMDRVQS